MSYSRDLILRMIEQMRNLLAKIVGLIEEGKTDEAQIEINTAAQKVTGKKLEELLSLDIQTLLELPIQGTEKERLSQLEYLSDILFLYASELADEEQKRRNALHLSGDLLDYVIQCKTSILDFGLEQKRKRLSMYMNKVQNS